ncbi:MAG TPA: kelch repeat-containing protein [Thermoplasmata archaeon]|nr:kelch repeat-containing protein [Thermoplasmata archaeon]
MAFDPKDHYDVLVTGIGSTGIAAAGVTWIFSKGNWTEPMAGNGTPIPAPPPRIEESMSYDTSDGYVVLFGGQGTPPSHSYPLRNDTWGFTNRTWTNLTPTSGHSPPGRVFASLSDDPGDNCTVLFSGMVGGSYQKIRNDSWEYHAGVWTNVTQGRSPEGRVGASGAYDSADRMVVLIGGASRGNIGHSDYWRFIGGGWAPLPLTIGLTARFGASSTFDAADGYVLLFGGTNGIQYFGATWAFAAGHWSMIPVHRSPPARYGASLSFDPRDGYAVLFGGYNGSFLSDTWTYRAGNWSELKLSVHPSGREFASMAYDGADKYELLFGGKGNTLLADTWVFSGGNWTHLMPKSHPIVRFGAAVGFVRSDNTTVLFGGETALVPYYVQDTWVYNAGHWKHLALVGVPPALAFAASSDYLARGYFFMFGGYNGAFLGSGWAFYQGNWTQISPNHSPAPRYGASMTYDVSDGYSLLFGGFGSAGYLVDTWAFRS